MLINILIAALLAGAVIIIIWLARGAMLTPVPLSAGQRLKVEISAGHGAAEALEQTVRALLWLVSNGTLPAQAIVIADDGMDAQTREMAEILSRGNQIVELYCPEELWGQTEIQTENT